VSNSDFSSLCRTGRSRNGIDMVVNMDMSIWYGPYKKQDEEKISNGNKTKDEERQRIEIIIRMKQSVMLRGNLKRV
jgi:hypothetical protein